MITTDPIDVLTSTLPPPALVRSSLRSLKSARKRLKSGFRCVSVIKAHSYCWGSPSAQNACSSESKCSNLRWYEFHCAYFVRKEGTTAMVTKKKHTPQIMVWAAVTRMGDLQFFSLSNSRRPWTFQQDFEQSIGRMNYPLLSPIRFTRGKVRYSLLFIQPNKWIKILASYIRVVCDSLFDRLQATVMAKEGHIEPRNMIQNFTYSNLWNIYKSLSTWVTSFLPSRMTPVLAKLCIACCRKVLLSNNWSLPSCSRL